MNLADPELELIDPTPNIHSLFVHFDELFFWTKLMGRVVVRWSKRMYSCAGICSYGGRGSACDIALSEPLLKLRPRKDLIETLLHEMIHAFLFITNRDNDRDGHGPNFQAHMHRINKAAGLNISIYHNFHDEVQEYLKHWWRCNGKCQRIKPFFGIIRRSSNRAPGPNDYWWERHRRMCGGTFIKIKEPRKPEKVAKKSAPSKTNADITKYINNNNATTMNKNVAKDINKKNNVTTINVKTTVPGPKKSPDIRNILGSGRQRTNSASVVETVRNVWANKQISSVSGSTSNNSMKSTNVPRLMKHKTNSVQIDSPPNKIKKIDDYFKSNVSSILKDVYGEEFMISQSHEGTKLKAVAATKDSRVPLLNAWVNCPICKTQVYGNDINKHLDECLNKDIIEKFSKDSIQQIPTPKTNMKVTDRQTSKDFEEVSKLSRIKPEIKSENKTQLEMEPKPENKNDDKDKLKSIIGNIKSIPPFKPKIDNTIKTNTTVNSDREDLEFFNTYFTIPESGPSKMETVVIGDFKPLDIKSEPGTSKDNLIQNCPCCGDKINKRVELHLDECRGFSNNITIRSIHGVSNIETITIDDDEDDRFDDSQIFNATGTKSPCPCCLKMIEIAEMNDHLDVCLST